MTATDPTEGEKTPTSPRPVSKSSISLDPAKSSTTAVAPAPFYSSSKSNNSDVPPSPAVASRSNTFGSSHTKFVSSVSSDAASEQQQPASSSALDKPDANMRIVDEPGEIDSSWISTLPIDDVTMENGSTNTNLGGGDASSSNANTHTTNSSNPKDTASGGWGADDWPAVVGAASDANWSETAPDHSGWGLPPLPNDKPPDYYGTAGTSSSLLHQDQGDYGLSSLLDEQLPTFRGVAISGRTGYEEKRWWDPTTQDPAHGIVDSHRPGPGMLPPHLIERVHNTDHALFSVSITIPDIKPGSSRPGATVATASVSGTNSVSSPAPEVTQASSEAGTTTKQDVPSTPSTSVSPAPEAAAPGLAPLTPPSEDEIRTAIPHPNAYYCRYHNSWVVFYYVSSTREPPLAESFRQKIKAGQVYFPDHNRRKDKKSCVAPGTGSADFVKENETHHFHRYENAIEPQELVPPLRRGRWERNEEGGNNSNNLLDIYVCCQCQLYCIVSDIIPGIVPADALDRFVADRSANPAAGETGAQAVVRGLETILTIIEDRLWRGENRALPVTKPTFQRRVGWSRDIERVFLSLGFETRKTEEELMLTPPVDTSTPTQLDSRAKLLRAWVELSAWLCDYLRRQPKLPSSKYKNWVLISNERESLQTAVGAHPDQIPRGNLPDQLRSVLTAMESLDGLGLQPSCFSNELLVFAYLAQCRCDPGQTSKYFTYLGNVVHGMMTQYVDVPIELQSFLFGEQARGRFTEHDYEDATRTLGFGENSDLGVLLGPDVPDTFVQEAYRHLLKQAWNDPFNGGERLKIAKDAIRIVCYAGGRVDLWASIEAEATKMMNPSDAYTMIEVPQDIDDAMLITVYELRVQEQPNQLSRMQEALALIAEVRGSERLRRFLNTGMDPGEVVAPTRIDIPRGLNQLGNTCYLNSLLQYLYTIEDLRQVIAPMANIDEKAFEEHKFTNDDLTKHRVGGRYVTKAEIMRSRKFLGQLALLFHQLEYSESPSVTPSMELAKLALTTSLDDEQDEIDRGGTASSNDTDATLVDDAPLRSRQLPSSPSVLGKRSRPLTGENISPLDDPMEGETTGVDSPKSVSSTDAVAGPSNPPSEGGKAEQDAPEASAAPTSKSLKPPAAARKTSGTTMMFGKQHDVSECMDNCMFQIETALLNFGGDSSEDNKTSVVKRLFYGKQRQRITAAPQVNMAPQSSTHEKEDLFSIIPVSVGEDGYDLYDALNGYFNYDVEFDGHKARMEVSIVESPPLLHIQLQRGQFDPDTHQSFKSQAYVKYDETIYVDRYLDGADTEKKARSQELQRELEACRERVRVLTKGKHTPFQSALTAAAAVLEMHKDVLDEVDDELIHLVRDEKTLIDKELQDIIAKLKALKEELEGLWKDHQQVAYELTSVFIHRGASIDWGHYFFYSRHLPEQPNSWFKYNDSEVVEVSKDEVFADTTGNTANPYLLVYAKKGSDVVHTVHRFNPADLVSEQAL